MFEKQAVEILGVFIPHRKSDLRHRVVGVVQQIHGVGYAQGDEVLGRGTAGDLLKVLGEPVRGHQVLSGIFLNLNIPMLTFKEFSK